MAAEIDGSAADRQPRSIKNRPIAKSPAVIFGLRNMQGAYLQNFKGFFRCSARPDRRKWRRNFWSTSNGGRPLIVGLQPCSKCQSPAASYLFALVTGMDVAERQTVFINDAPRCRVGKLLRFFGARGFSKKKQINRAPKRQWDAAG